MKTIYSGCGIVIGQNEASAREKNVSRCADLACLACDCGAQTSYLKVSNLRMVSVFRFVSDEAVDRFIQSAEKKSLTGEGVRFFRSRKSDMALRQG